jgi:tetratricopeptide (TPR) repeat protein
LNTALGASDDAELRRLAKLPLVTVSLGIFGGSKMETSEDRFVKEIAVKAQSAAGTNGPAAEVAYLKAHLKGNASDAASQVYLGRLYAQLNDNPHAQQASQEATRLIRQQLQSKPNDPELLLELASLLTRANQLAEAETLLRSGGQAHPDDWRFWPELAQLLFFRATQAVGWERLSVRTEEVSEMVAWMASHPPTAAQRSAAEKYLSEMPRAYDRAVELAPKEPEAYGARVALRGIRNAFQAALRGQGTPRAGSMAWSLDRDSLTDLRRLCQLSQTNAGLFGVTAAYLCFAEMENRKLEARFPAQAWPNLSAETRDEVTKLLQQLETLARSPSSGEAAQALAILAGCQFMLLGDLSGAERNADHSLRLDPRQDEAYKALFMVYSTQNRFPDLAALYERRLALEPSAMNFLMLAKAHEKSGRLARAEQALRDGLRVAPRDVLLQLGLASLLLRRDSAPLSEVATLLNRIEPRRASLSTETQADFFFERGLERALAGRTAEAQISLEESLKLSPRGGDTARALDLLAGVKSGKP